MSERQPKYFENKVVIVIGAASGIGAALCRLLAHERQGDRGGSGFPRAEELAYELGAPAEAFKVDSTARESVQAVIEHSVARQGGASPPDQQCRNPAAGDAKDFADADSSRVLHINLHGAAIVTMAAYRVMLNQGFGYIVNIASLSGLNLPPHSLPYVTSKYAVVGMAIALRAEAKPRGVRVG